LFAREIVKLTTAPSADAFDENSRAVDNLSTDRFLITPGVSEGFAVSGRPQEPTKAQAFILIHAFPCLDFLNTAYFGKSAGFETQQNFDDFLDWLFSAQLISAADREGFGVTRCTWHDYRGNSYRSRRPKINDRDC